MSITEWVVALVFIPVAARFLRKFTFSLSWAVALPVMGAGLYGLLRYEHLTLSQSLASAIFLFDFNVPVAS